MRRRPRAPTYDSLSDCREPSPCSTLTLPDVYAVIAYYLRHRGEIEDYLARRERQAQEVRQRIERSQGDLKEIRDRISARRQP